MLVSSLLDRSPDQQIVIFVLRRHIAEPHFENLLALVNVTPKLSVGYVVWLARGGVLLASLLSSMPAWRIVDPLPILSRAMDDEDVDGGDSLASLIDAGIARGAGPGTPLRSIRVNGMELPAPIDSLPSHGTSDT